MASRKYLLSKLRQYVRRQHRRDFRDFIEEAAQLSLWRRLAFCWLLLWKMPSDPRKRRQWFASRQMPDTEPKDHPDLDEILSQAHE